MEQYNQYRVWIYIQGAPSRPPYDGYVDVYAPDDEVGERAIQKLRRTSFPDVWPSSFKVKRIERTG